MFSTIIPGIPTNVKFMPNGPPKQPNRLPIRVVQPSSSQPFPYAWNPTSDLGYRSLPHPEQVPPDWYGKSAHYPVYPNVTNPPLIYEQPYTPEPTQIFDFDDASSIASFPAYSPAMSTDSMETLKSPVESGSVIEVLDTPSTYPIYSNYPVDPSATSQALAVSKSSSIYRSSDGHVASQEFSANVANAPLRMTTPFRPIVGDNNVTSHIHYTPYIPYIPSEDAASTISEFEVEERDQIAKLNAEYNSVSSTHIRHNSFSSHVARNTDDLGRAPPAPSRHMVPSQTSGFSRLASSQPLHPDLNFPTRGSGSAKGATPISIYASSDGSPPSVERVPSHLPTEDVVRIHANGFSEHLPTQLVAGSRRESLPDSNNSPRNWNHGAPIVYPIKNSPTMPSSSYSAHIKDSGGTQVPFPDQARINEIEQRKNWTYSLPIPSGLSQDRNNTENKNPNVISKSGQDDDTNLRNDDKHVRTQYIYQDVASSPSSDALRSHRNSPMSQPLHSSPRKQVPQPSEVDEKGRTAVGVTLRNDTRTSSSQLRDRNLTEPESARHSPSSRRVPSSQTVPESPSRGLSEVRSSPQTRDNDVVKQQSIVTPSDGTHRSIYNGDIVQNTTNANRSYMLDSGGQRSSSTSKSSRQLTSSSPDRKPEPTFYDVRHGTDYERERDKELDKDRHSRNGSTSQRLSSSRSAESTPESARKTIEPYYDGYQGHPPVQVSHEGEGAIYNQPEPLRVTVKTASINDSKSNSANQMTKTRDEMNLFPAIHDNRKAHHHHIRQPSSLSSSGQSEIAVRSGSDERRVSSRIYTSSTHHSSPKMINDSSQTITPPEPHRRYSDGDQTAPHIHAPMPGSVPTPRSVRWTENLIAPSPVLAPPKRKGWFNRRGDQLWTNDGAYMPPRTGEDYPFDLDDYPEYGEGWMNEDGIRIDMDHRRIPKSPPRSALKSSLKS